MKKTASILLLAFFMAQGVAFPFSFDEAIVKQGAANLQKNIEPVKGRLSLTPTKLVFEPHGLNLQRKTVVVDLNTVVSADTGWSKLLGVIPAVPNALKITTRNGAVYRFTCYFPGRWKDAVEKQIASGRSSVA